MVHYVFGIRGDYLDVERVINRLANHAFLMPYKNKDGTTGNLQVLGRVEPIQIFSYVFPENALDVVLNSLGGSQENMKRWYGKGIQNETIFYALRKALHCQPIPKKFKTDMRLLLPEEELKHLSIMPIGIKRDIMEWQDSNGTIHEAL